MKAANDWNCHERKQLPRERDLGGSDRKMPRVAVAEDARVPCVGAPWEWGCMWMGEQILLRCICSSPFLGLSQY